LTRTQEARFADAAKAAADDAKKRKDKPTYRPNREAAVLMILCSVNGQPGGNTHQCCFGLFRRNDLFVLCKTSPPHYSRFTQFVSWLSCYLQTSEHCLQMTILEGLVHAILSGTTELVLDEQISLPNRRSRSNPFDFDSVLEHCDRIGPL
jgi:hypothetical protein